MSNHPTEQMPDIGRVAEWIKAPHLKCDVGESLPGVRIPWQAPNIWRNICQVYFWLATHILVTWACVDLLAQMVLRS